MKEDIIQYSIIPENILKDYLNRPLPNYNMFCSCGHLNEHLRGLPWAWDDKEHEVIWMYKCEYCGELMYTKD